MIKRLALLTLITNLLPSGCSSSLPADTANATTDCLINSLETSLYCRGSRAINNIINNLSKTDKPVVIVRGLEIVPSKHSSNNTADGIKSNVKGVSGNEEEENHEITLLGRFSNYLRTHELRVKFHDLWSPVENEPYLFPVAEQHEARKKDKGTGMMMAFGLMMSKAMAVMGLGGIAALAMKALGIAMTALMLATMVGVKSMTQHGNEPPHSIQYVTADGHHHLKRRRRSSDSLTNLLKVKGEKLKPQSLAYRNWPRE